MPGYKDRIIHLEFPDLGDDIWVDFRNPRIMPPSMLTPDDVPVGPDGAPLDPAEGSRAMNKLFATLVKAWSMYDAADDSDSPAMLASPPTGADMAKAPMAIITALSEELEKATSPR